MALVKLSDLPTKHYVHRSWNSDRWQGFQARPDDILICTSYKAGTTWTQMICALLIFQRTEFDQPLSDISPWLELRAAPKEDIHAIYDAQQHRRFIKTHTPLDGLPWLSSAKYICVLRDPRDIFISMFNQMKNSNPDADALFAKESRKDRESEAVSDDPNDVFKTWMTTGSFDWETDGAPYWSVFRHGFSFWEHRDQPNIALYHYSDLKADLKGGMRDIARYLEIDIPEEKWPELVAAAGFDSMKARADQMAPDTRFKMWKDNARFFNKGSSGQWQGVLSNESLALLDDVTGQYPSDYIDWLFRG